MARALFAALVVLFGLQSMRFLFASMSWYLRDTLGIGVLDLIPIAFAPFVLAGLLPAVSRWAGFRNVLGFTAILLVAARLLLQMADDPGQDFWFSALGTFAFVGMLPFLLSLGRSALVAGILVGIALDSAIRGLGLSLDLAFVPGWRAVVAVAALGLALAWAYAGLGGVQVQGVGWGEGLALLTLAPFLFVEMLLLQSQGWTSAVTGISGPTAQLRIAALNILAVYLAYKLAGNRIAFVVSLVVVAAAALVAEGDGNLYNILSLVAVPAAGVLWAGVVPDPETDRMGVSSLLLLGGASLFLVFGLSYYVPLDMDLGFDAPAVRIAAAALLLVFGAAAITRMSSLPALGKADWLLAAGAALVPAIAFVGAQTAPDLEAAEPVDPVRFVSYNIHSGFDTGGTLDLEAIARVIEDTRADVVGLQEVPRGQLLSANVDALTLLQLELGYEHIAFFGTTDPVWGNAVLSRYPIVGVESEYLPRVGTPMRRGYLGAAVLIGDREVLVVSTHLQHVNDSSVHDEDPEADLLPVHSEQIAEILEQWGGQAPAVLMGDFNARPDWAQISMLVDAGWVDSWVEAGIGDGFTSSATDPRYRIDYVFHTADLTATDAGVYQSTASDHFAVIADISFE